MEEYSVKPGRLVLERVVVMVVFVSRQWHNVVVHREGNYITTR